MRRKALRQRSHYHRHANPKRYKRVPLHVCPICTCTCARVSAQAYDVDTRACSVSCKYEYYRVVYTSSLQGLHYTLISLREPCRDGLYKWWPYDNTVTLTTRILLRRSSLRIEYTMNGLIIKDRGRRNTKDADFSVPTVK